MTGCATDAYTPSAVEVIESNGTFAANVFEGNPGSALAVTGGAPRGERKTFKNNLLDRSGSGLTLNLATTSAVVANNVWLDNKGMALVSLVGQNAEWRHNLVNAPGNQWGNTQSVTGWQATNLFDVDPLLDPNTFTPLAASPSLNAGRATDAPANDFYGAPRHAAGGSDLGAVERP